MIQIVILVCAMSERGPEFVQMVVDPPQHITSCEQFDPQRAAHAVGAVLIRRGVAFERLGVRCVDASA